MSRSCACADEFLVLLMSLEWRGVIVHVRAKVRPNKHKLAWFGRIIARVRVGIGGGFRYSKAINSEGLINIVFVIILNVFGFESVSETINVENLQK